MSDVPSLYLKEASQLVTVATGGAPRAGGAMGELGIIPGGSVAVSGGRITGIGSEGELRERCTVGPRTKVLDCRGKVVLPGLVDSHTHPVFVGFRLEEYEMRSRGASYQEIARAGGGIASSVREVRAASEEELARCILPRLDRFLLHGASTIEAKSGYGLSLKDELKSLRVIKRLGRLHPIDVVPTFLGAHAFPPEYTGDHRAYMDVLISEMIPKIAEEGLAEYCDVFVEEGYFSVDEGKDILRAATAAGLKGRVHADELSAMGAAELAAQSGAVSADHLVYVSDEGIRSMARGGVIAVLLPGTTFFLGSRRYAPARRLIDGGVPVALATDFNPGSSTTLNLQQIMTIAVTHMGMTAVEALSATTINAACAVGMDSLVGSIEVGKLADLAIFDVEDYREIPYIFGENHCEAVIKRGRVVVEGGRRYNTGDEQGSTLNS